MATIKKNPMLWYVCITFTLLLGNTNVHAIKDIIFLE